MNPPQTVRGVVEGVSRKTIANGKTRLGIVMFDVWYNLLTRQLEPIGIGAQVEFVATEKPGALGWCIHPGTLRVIAPAPLASVSKPADDDVFESWSDDDPNDMVWQS